jgi:hypothetical protein
MSRLPDLAAEEMETPVEARRAGVFGVADTASVEALAAGADVGARSSASVLFATTDSAEQMEVSASSRERYVDASAMRAEAAPVSGDGGALLLADLDREPAQLLVLGPVGRFSATCKARDSGADCSTEQSAKYEDTEISLVIDPTLVSMTAV